MKYRLKSLFNFISNMYEAYSHVGYLLSLIPYSVILNCVVVCLVKAAKSKIKKKNDPLKSTTVSNVPCKHLI